MIKTNGGTISPKVLKKENNIALLKVLDDIKGLYGKGAIMMLGEETIGDIEAISTGSIGLDIALGVGGIPKGRVIEIYGPESSGKTTIALSIAAQCQKEGGNIAIIDAEHSLDPKYARKLGINIDELAISQPDNGEMALEIAEALIKSSAIDVLIVDSVAALVPRAEMEGNIGDQNIGLQARLMSQALRKLVSIISKTNCTVIFINQLRDKVGNLFGSSEITTGGRALKFFSSVRLDIRRKEVIKNGNDAVGNRVRIKVVKNKVASPFRSAELTMLYDEGIDKLGEVVDLGIHNGIISKSGNWLLFKDNVLGQGRENVKSYLRNDSETRKEIENMLLQQNGLMVKQ